MDKRRTFYDHKSSAWAYGLDELKHYKDLSQHQQYIQVKYFEFV